MWLCFEHHNYAPEDKEKQSHPVFWKWNLLPWIAFEVWVWFVDQLIVLKQNYRWYTLKNWVWWLQKKKWLYWWQRQWCWRWARRFWLSYYNIHENWRFLFLLFYPNALNKLWYITDLINIIWINDDLHIRR